MNRGPGRPKALGRTGAERDRQVIVLGVDSPIGLAVVRELGLHGIRVHGLAWSRRGIGLYSRFLHRGHLREPDEDQLVGQINTIATQEGCRWLMTVSESDIQMLHRRGPELTGVTALVPSPEAFGRVLDKQTTVTAAREAGIRVPDTWRIERLSELAALSASLSYPLVLKWSNPLEAMRRAGPLDITIDKYRYVHGYEELYAYLQPLESIGLFPLIQSYCPGYGIGHMVFMHRGEPLLTFQHRRIAEWPPEGGYSVVCESLPREHGAELMARSVSLLRALDWEGPAMVEYRYDPKADQAVLMEVNGRFWGSLPLAFHAGAPFAWLTYALGALGETPVVEDYEVGYRCRYLVPELKRLARILFRPGAIQNRRLHFSRPAELGRFLAAYFRPRTRYFVFWWKDPRPFLVDAWFILRRALGRA